MIYAYINIFNITILHLPVKNKRTWKKQHASFFWGWWVGGWVPTFLKDTHGKRLIINFEHKNHGPTLIDQGLCGYVEASRECILDLHSFKLSFLRGYAIPKGSSSNPVANMRPKQFGDGQIHIQGSVLFFNFIHVGVHVLQTLE